MIGVVAAEAQRSWVEEFFELFKTAWEFHRGDGHYNVLICTTDEIPSTSATLVFAFQGRAIPADLEAQLANGRNISGTMLTGLCGDIPIYGSCRTFASSGQAELSEAATGEAVMATRKTGATQLIRIGYDLFAEVQHLLSQGQPAVHAHIPTLERHISLLRTLIVRAGVFLVEVPPVPQGCGLIACLTHDMDHPALRHHKLDHTLAGFLYRATVGSILGVVSGRMSFAQLAQNWVAALKTPLVLLGWVDDFWRQTGHYLALEREMNSTFFVIPTKNDPGRNVARATAARRASPYEAADIAPELEKIGAAGHEVGVHGIDAWMDEESGRAERSKVTQAAKRDCRGIRMHWLCHDPETPAILEAGGYDYDSTVGYNECVGYRAGTTQVYRPPGANKLLELPLHVMDTALLYPGYLNFTQSQAAQRMAVMVDEVASVGGVLTVNWHDRSLAPERLWLEPYTRLLQKLRRKQAWCASAGQAVRWFRRRRSAKIQCATNADASAVVRINVADEDSELPGMMARAYNLADGSGTLENPVEFSLISKDGNPIQFSRESVLTAS